MIHVARTDKVIRGLLALEGVFQAYTLENPTKQIPAGTYTVRLTESARAKAGTLWTPWADHKLPLIDVPGREGIRIHSANRVDQLEGCIAVGQGREDDQITQSRVALTALKDKLTFPCQITIEESV